MELIRDLYYKGSSIDKNIEKLVKVVKFLQHHYYYLRQLNPYSVSILYGNIAIFRYLKAFLTPKSGGNPQNSTLHY